ncbi:2-oxoglutarate dehydrogenase complex dihydrolipoyllysine-residue succinyltransferase [Wohlfahrtiimonas chitiniclastica]|uniref:Dihydrolipoyllysine-residue succinyltransferase component of 2-oxoglutarate dehydrogenase complex n=1 Tax=Wohlfahrtiimonas chitiniclastica SH04 TaxID=1261130 RepID=L8XYZ0_9GAMM|nr:2-oxoglutarate dehydrogenase complex dihydrolipoyllysine-residue succinyltransferase [Wohlfahrtiimonas chitiniclastica]ELV08029.1 Dihydrolipoyllysine-residue succinyltransferase component of 2-oxoglutarate dehydrogenase complex [Wohlfahrtiimonas chitiniclastica SH04]MBS7814444.1 2-oxoglutarate dehydrogenase complex dihydrolipoyllysine-residue succinyltransferase [Wohlfahrtiimonas chitiniclastica]MBS7818398.1 2-oxoglutarate dehydrogenase complex dihydrolipoyllysine-residue succinyltransferase 
MSIEIKVPVLPESVADALLAVWHVKEGDFVEEGDNLVDLETDKVMLEVPATVSGTIQSIKIAEGTNVTAGEVLAVLVEGAAAPKAEAAPAEAPKAEAESAHKLSPAVKVLVEENKLDISVIPATGKDGRHTKEDILNFLEKGAAAPKAPAPAAPKAAAPTAPLNVVSGNRTEQRVPMTRLRATIAERLLEAKNSTAMLTTFNEVNMKNVIDLRKKYKDEFEKRHGIKLGFMSFFVKAAVEALKKYPAVNASIDGNDMIYHGYFDIGVAVSSPRGLVVPVIRDADQKSLAEIEKTIMDFAIRAKEGKLGLEDMTGGTFTVTNGGVFGSMLSTPIINPPQSGILGMHKTYDRPIAENGQVVIAPMMYLAHSYDHRIIDGKEAVGFLVAIKDAIEDPTRLLLDI